MFDWISWSVIRESVPEIFAAGSGANPSRDRIVLEIDAAARGLKTRIMSKWDAIVYSPGGDIRVFILVPQTSLEDTWAEIRRVFMGEGDF